MTNLLLVAAGVAVALVVSVVARRRRPDAPTQGGFRLPAQVDRSDFPHPERPWLVVVFTSATCNACADVLAKARVAESRDVAVVDVEYTERRDLHDRYAVDAVPSLIVVDADGTVRAGFLGPVKAQDLWAAVAECREPGSTPAHESPLGRTDTGRTD
ncbi:MAG: TlpA family protein disulfide reductase [Actinomycetota bacterium]